MQPFKSHRGILATLNRANVDTDQIIPKQFLKSIKRTGFGKSLFFDWRYAEDGSTPNPEFELNQPRFANASILVTRSNFGCGSSREHAVWAIAQDGYRVVISAWQDRNGTRVPGFADIFRNNSVKNGLLMVELGSNEVDTIFEQVEANEGLEASVDLEKQTILLHTDPAIEIPFEIEPGIRDHLLRGLDDIALTLDFDEDISRYEAGHEVFLHRA